MSLRSTIEKKVKTAASMAANLSRESWSIDPIADPLVMVSIKLGGSENIDLKMSRSKLVQKEARYYI